MWPENVLISVCQLFESALEDSGAKSLPHMWRTYLSVLASGGGEVDAARRTYYRAVHHCPWSKELWALAGSPALRNAFDRPALDTLLAAREGKGIYFRCSVK